jgi:hypothetical protein
MLGFSQRSQRTLRRSCVRSIAPEVDGDVTIRVLAHLGPRSHAIDQPDVGMRHRSLVETAHFLGGSDIRSGFFNGNYARAHGAETQKEQGCS